MKFYNPFKWHIRKFGDYYVVAKRGVLFWHYMDYKDGYPWSSATDYWRKYCLMHTIEEARNLLSSYKEIGYIE